MADSVDDMITLSELTEDAIMENIRIRYDQKKIYTYTGSILVAMNPFERMDVYNLPILKKYMHKRPIENPPHIFAIAETAYANVRQQRVNQSVIISGESGAGKSESTKVILQYLTTVTSKESKESWVEQQILEANTVLESFGNAKTVRNNNSSRFGKFIQVNFNRNAQIIGASIINYLLEKSRIAKQAPTERNYHIFYELLAGANDDERQKYQLDPPESYHYLSQSGCVEIPGVDDVRNYEALKLALTVLKLTPVEQDGLFSTLSAILTVGNIRFAEGSNDQVDVSNREVVEKVAGLMGIDAEALRTALRFRKLVIRGETSMVPYKLAQANDTRDAFAKALYNNLFQRIVEFINRSLTSKEKASNFVGVLDIFGFEVFKVNSFEQFCINFTNEKLQQFFNQFIFKLEQEEYDKEGIQWDKIQFQDNAACLDLIEGKPAGILALLDEETRFPKGTDETWLSKLDQAVAKHPHYIKPKTQKSVFGIKHYAGDVLYTVTTFLDKNKDAIQDELYDVVRVSSIPYIAKLFPVEEKEEAQPGKGPRAGGKPTAGTHFKNQLVSLVSTLGATTPHYVRCIKPNQEKEAFLFDTEVVLAQLRYSGMLDTIRIRKAGYSTRLAFDYFAKTFKCLVPSGMTLMKDDPRDISAGIAAEANLYDGAWQLGQTKIFLKDDALAAIQDRATAVLKQKVVLMQKTMLGYMYRKRFLEMRKSARLLQVHIRGFLCKRRYKRVVRATVKIQAVVRGWFARDLYRKLMAEKRAAEQRRAADKKAAEEQRAAAAAAQRASEAATQPAAQMAKPPVVVVEPTQTAEPVEVKQLLAPGDRRASVSRPSVLAPSREDGEKLINAAKAVQKKKEAMAAAAAVAATGAPTTAAATSAPAKRQTLQIDNLFSFLGDFDPSNRTGIEGADLLKRMADELTADIDALFDEAPEVREEARAGSGGQLAVPATAAKAGAGRVSVPSVSGTPTALSQVSQADSQRPTPRESIATPKSASHVDLSRKGVSEVKVIDIQASHEKLLAHNPLSKSYEDLDVMSSHESIAKVDYNAPDLQMQAYAEKHFEQHMKASGFATITKKRQYVDLNDMLAYSKNPMPTSLTKMPHKTEKLDHMALECFKILLKASDPSAKKPEEYLQAVLGYGIETPELRDEIFVQMVKQVTAPKELPKAWDQLIVSGWQALTLATASFPPSKVLGKFLLAFIQRTMAEYAARDRYGIRKLAVAAEEAVRRVMLNGPRKAPPSLTEIHTLKSGGALPCRFGLLDGRTLDITIALTTTAGDVVKEMARTIKLKTAAGWSLYEVKSNQERAIKATEYVADFLSAWDRDSGSKKKDAGTVRKKKGDAPGASGVSADSRLIMKKRVFRDIQQDITDPVEYGLLFAQAVDGVTKDVYPITERTAMQLAALKAQVLFGDCTAASAEARFVQDLESWIAPRLIPNQPKEAWVTGIVKQYQKLRGQSAEQAKALYLESVRGFKHYGAALFPAKHKGLWPHSESVLIAVSSGGIDFVHPRTNETTLSFPYKDVKSYEHEPGLLTITAVPANEDSEFEATEVYPFFTEQSDEIVLLIREYCPTTEYMKKTKVASVVWDLDYASLVRDVEKYRSALLEYGIMRRPGPDGGSKKSMFFTIRKRAGTVRSKTPPLFAADSTGTIGRSTNDSVRPGSVRSRLGDESDDTAVSPVAPLALEDMPAGPGVTDDYGMSDWSFSGKPLMTSLIATPDPEVENWASETSAVLLKFVGPPGATAPDIASGDVQALQAVLERCVDVPPMANELYLQLIKNTSSHPQPDSSQALNMWKLMAIAVGVCAPSGWVLEYTKAHLRQYCVIDNKSKKPRPEEAQHARHCLRVLHRTIATAVRKCAPSADEIAQAIRLTPIRVRIHLMDGNARVIPIDPPDTCEMVLTAVLERLKLKNGRGFAIYEQYKSFQRALHPEQKIADSLYRWEKIAKTENSTEHVRFVFRKRLFLAAQQSTGPAEEALLRAQALAEIGAGLYPVTSEEAIQLVALFAQSYYGDFNYDVPVQYQSLCDLYLPPAFRQPGVAKQVEERHMSFLGMTADQANAEIMQIVRSWPYYGAAIFEVTQNYTKEVPQSCWFAVDSKAVHIMPRQSKQPLITHRLSEIVNFSPSSNSLLLITEDGHKYVFTTTHATEVADLIRDYTDIEKGGVVRASNVRGSHLHLAG